MTVQSSRYTAAGDLSVYAGEALAIELAILRDGVPIDPIGREGALTLWRTTNRAPILDPIPGETIDGTDATHGSVKLLRYVLPGSATDLVFTKHRTDCGYQIASANADGLDYRLIGKVLPKASASLGAVTGSGEPPVVALSLETRTQRIVVDARGAPGLAIWEVLGLSVDAYDASVRQPALDAVALVDDAITDLGEFTSDRSAEIDDAIDKADADVAAFTTAARADVDAKISETEAARAATVTATTDTKAATVLTKDATVKAQGVVDAGAQILTARDQAIAYAPSTFETTDATPRMYLTDAAGRIILELPDPRVAALLGSVAQLNASAIFETTDAGGLSLLDAGGREVLRIPDPAVTATQLAALGASVGANTVALAAQAPLLAAASGSGVFETTDVVAKAYVLDVGGRVVQQFPDPNVAPLLATAATGNVYETTDLSIAAIVLDASGRVAAQLPSQAAVAVPTTVQEVVTARGNMPSLSARLGSVLTPDAAPIVDRYGRSFLRRTHYLLMKRALPTPESAQLIINAPGDSYTHNAARWSGPAMDVLAARYGDAGGGWCGFGGLAGGAAPWTLTNQPPYTNGNVRPAIYPTRLFGSIAQTYFTAASPDLAMATLTQAGDQCFQAFPAAPVHNACDLFFFGTGDGVIRYSWGTYKGSGSVADPASYTFAAATSLNVQGTINTTQIADIKAGMPAGQGALLIEWVAGSAKLFGVNLKSAASGVRINKLAATGSAINSWANAPATQWEVGLAALGAQLVVYMDGTNSQTGGMPATTWGTHLTNLVARFRSATPAIDVLIATPPENQRTTNSVPMTAYATEGRKRALAGRFAFLDMQPAFGDPNNVAEYAWNGPVPLFANESPAGIHPEPQTGGRLLAAEFIDFIVPY